MKPSNAVLTSMLAIFGVVVLPASQALGGAHTWRVNEVYSNADGTVQFIELLETCGGTTEVGLSGHQVTSTSNSVNLVSIPPGSSSNRHILLGTANLSSLGGPTPDYIIPADFFSLVGDTIQYTPFHSCAIASGTVPTDGTNALQRPPGCGGATCVTLTGVNSPTNFAGETGTIILPGPLVPAASDWGLGVLGLVLVVLATFLIRRRIATDVAAR